MRRGSALLMALWIILSLSVIVLSFAFEAHLQGGVNVYVQNKNRVKRLLDAGRVLGEVVLLGYNDAKQWTEDEDLKSELEDDRWYVEKQKLKYSKGCTIGPILLDEDDPDAGTVKVEIALSSSDAADGINVNALCKEKDSNFEDRWRIILDLCGVPRGEVKDEDGKSVNLQSYIIASWQDYRDEDDQTYQISDTSTTTGYSPDEASEKKVYRDYYDKHEDDFAEEDCFEPANGEIGDLKELSRIICFRKFPAVLTGGILSKDGKKDATDKKMSSRRHRAAKDDGEVEISPGLVNMKILGVRGDGKVNVNRCTVEQLLTVPGIFDVDEVDEDDKTESREIAEAIVACRTIKPQDYDVPETQSEWGYGEFTSDWWSDLVKRVADEFDLTVSSDAKNYLTARPAETGVLFKMVITASIMDMEYTAECECYVKDKKVRYVSWKEN